MAKPKKKSSRKWLYIIVLLLIAIGASTPFFLKRREMPIEVQTEKVKRRSLTEEVIATGKIQPVTQVKISPEVSGEIIELPVKEGQQIKKGDLLLKIKPDFYLANRASAQANYQGSIASLNSAKANLIKSEMEFKRVDGLFKDKVVSDSQFIEAKTTFDMAKANTKNAEHQVEMAQASLARAEEELAKTTIYSPLTGTISKLNSQLGERVVGTATMAGTEVMILADLNEMEARVDVGEIDVVLIQIGQKAVLEVDSFRDKKFHGVVTEIANSAKTSSMGTQQEATKFEVKIRIQEKEVFRPGMSVNARIATRSSQDAISVPFPSVTIRLPSGKVSGTEEKEVNMFARKQDEETPEKAPKKVEVADKPIEVVFIVENNRAKMVPIERGISDDDYTEIIKGLKEGDEVISGGFKAINRELENGKLIRVTTSPAPPQLSRF